MSIVPMNILIIEDNVEECNAFINCVKRRTDFTIGFVTDSDIEGLRYAKLKRPDGIILDIELNNSVSGNVNSLDFLINLKKLNTNYNPIIIVTTHINSKRTYDIFHKNGADIILYKGHPSYSCEFVLNTMISLKDTSPQSSVNTLKEIMENNKEKVSEYINSELDLIGISPKLKGREYLYNAITYLIENKDNPNCPNVFQHLVKIHGKSDKTIINGIQTAILRAWRISSIEDLSNLYTARINPETGYPTPNEFIYYYVNKLKKYI